MSGDYKKEYRFKRSSVSWLAEHFLSPNSGDLTPVERMELCLRYLTDSTFELNSNLSTGQHKVVSECIDSIYDKHEDWIRFPSDSDEFTHEMMSWTEQYSIPKCVGVVGCIHIPSQDVPSASKPSSYLKVQVACNVREEATSVVIAWPGSVPNWRMFRNSPLPGHLMYSREAVLLGDSSYASVPYLITPYQNPNTPKQIFFNDKIKSESAVVRRVLHQVKSRFSILTNPVGISLDDAPKLVLACFVLHNVGKQLKDDFVDSLDEDVGDGNSNDGLGKLELVDDEVWSDLCYRGNKKRDKLAGILYQRESSKR